jgi:hypothetical protein
MSSINKNYIYNVFYLENILHNKLINKNFYQKLFLIESALPEEDDLEIEKVRIKFKRTRFKKKYVIKKNKKILIKKKKSWIVRSKKQLMIENYLQIFDTYSNLEYAEHDFYIQKFFLNEGYSYKGFTKIASLKYFHPLNVYDIFLFSKNNLTYIKKFYKKKLLLLCNSSNFSIAIAVKAMKGGFVIFNFNFQLYFFIQKRKFKNKFKVRTINNKKNLLPLIKAYNPKRNLTILVNYQAYLKKKKKKLLTKKKRKKQKKLNKYINKISFRSHL